MNTRLHLALLALLALSIAADLPRVRRRRDDHPWRAKWRATIALAAATAVVLPPVARWIEATTGIHGGATQLSILLALLCVRAFRAFLAHLLADEQPVPAPFGDRWLASLALLSVAVTLFSNRAGSPPLPAPTTLDGSP